MTSPNMTHAVVLGAANGCNATVPASDVRPAIIPPMLGKISIHPVIANQWRSAIAALKHAREVIVVGYSFPETDTFMPRLLAEGLHSNDDLARVIVADIGSADIWAAKINRMFAPVFLKKKVRHVHISAVDALNVVAGQGLNALVGRSST